MFFCTFYNTQTLKIVQRSMFSTEKAMKKQRVRNCSKLKNIFIDGNDYRLEIQDGNFKAVKLTRKEKRKELKRIVDLKKKERSEQKISWDQERASVTNGQLKNILDRLEEVEKK